MSLKIEWNSTPQVRHVAEFSATRGIVTTTYLGTDVPARVEEGPSGVLLTSLLNPGGRYRLAPMLADTFRLQIEVMLESEPEHQTTHGLHPLIAQALQPWAPRSSNVHTGSGS